MQKKTILIVYAHPEPQSMNGTLFQTAIQTFTQSGHDVLTTDLYEQAFNPVSGRHNFRSQANATFFKQQSEESSASQNNGFARDVEEEIEKILACDLMIWQFPLWWFSVPAVLKGWVDRVFAMGRLYGPGRIYENGVCKGKKALLSLTTGGVALDYQSAGLQGDIMGILRPLHRGILEFTGFAVLTPQITYSPARQSNQALTAELEAYMNRLRYVLNEPGIDVGQY